MKRFTENTTGWQDSPDDTDTGIKYPIWRVGAAKPSKVIVLSSNLVGRYTHYFSGRTLPCGNEVCAACEAGNSRRWHGWLHTTIEQTNRTGILELTAHAASLLKAELQTLGNLRGLELTLKRVPAIKTGKVWLKAQRSRIDATLLPREINVRAVLDQMWEIAAGKSGRPRDRAAEPIPQPVSVKDVLAQTNGNGHIS